MSILFLLIDSNAMMTILRNGSSKISPKEFLHNDHIYDGRENYISLARNYSEDFTCEFSMMHYPFDIQICTMNFMFGVGLDICSN